MATFTLPTRFSSLSIDASGLVVSSITGQFGGTILYLDALAAHGDSAWATATGFAVAGNAMTLTTAYDAAKTAAQASDIPTSDITAIRATTDGLVNTAGKLWVLDGSGNAVAPASQTQAIQNKTDNLPASPAATGDIPTATDNADAVLDRDMSLGSDSGSPTVRTVRQALRFLRNKWSIAGGTLTVYKEDDTATSWTSAITTSAGNPVSTSDPA